MLLLHATAHYRSESSQRFGYHHGVKNTPVSSKFPISKNNRVFSTQLSLSDRPLVFNLPPFLNTYHQSPGDWLVNYFSVIRPSAGQTTQPQSCASLYGVDWKRSTLNWTSLSVTRVWSTPTILYSLLGPLRASVRPGRFMTLIFLSALLRGFRCVVLCRRNEVGKMSQCFLYFLFPLA
ncbi:hypothetical protein AVEN_116082-1 [Araneus ventricosus]|uniref:Uncharacterized protein n=1 Tax=Araneus ventricosus TaxID=182803 RepID=A0A4Y2TZL4_ARAVE|nr:hypothetical protein AVEN_116082-1 [Araneus ventricosus]